MKPTAVQRLPMPELRQAGRNGEMWGRREPSVERSAGVGWRGTAFLASFGINSRAPTPMTGIQGRCVLKVYFNQSQLLSKGTTQRELNSEGVSFHPSYCLLCFSASSSLLMSDTSKGTWTVRPSIHFFTSTWHPRRDLKRHKNLQWLEFEWSIFWAIST